MDGYSTHLPYLKEFAEGVAVEFGSGKYSTPLLLKQCDYVMSIEMQDGAWLERVRNEFVSEEDKLKWHGVRRLGAWQFLGLEYPKVIDFGFVDGHGKSRFGCVNFLMRMNCPVILAHDMNGISYRWDLVNPIGYTRFDFKRYTNYTSAWIRDDVISNPDFLDKHREFFKLNGYPDI